MVVYSYLIDPGHEPQYYNDHIQAAAPYCSIVAGIPLMFLAGRWIGRWWQGEFAIRSALVVWLAYAIVDIAILVGAGITSKIAVLAAISILTKLGSIYLGAVFADSSRRVKSIAKL
jgi:hypothetical protein